VASATGTFSKYKIVRKDACSMIKVTRLNGEPIYINSDLIEFIETTPDTIITLTTGKKVIIKENIEYVIQHIVDYNKKIRQYDR
jgi:flagellar protein FlbD